VLSLRDQPEPSWFRPTIEWLATWCLLQIVPPMVDIEIDLVGEGQSPCVDNIADCVALSLM